MRLALACAFLLVVAPSAHAFDRSLVDGLLERERLLGDWNGLRPALADHGIDVGLVYTADVVGNVRGGVHRRVEYLDNTDLTLTADLERLVGWPGASVYLYGLGNGGGDPSANVGDLQVTDNIEAPDTWKLYEAWFMQDLFEERLSLLLGLYDLNGEFYVTETSGLFLNSSFGIGADASQSGKNGPSIFPTTSAAVRVRVAPTVATYVQVAVLDGVAGSVRDPNGTQIDWQRDDGVLVVAEAGWTDGTDDATLPYTKVALGGWTYGAGMPTVASEGERESRGAYGLYALGERTVYRDPADPARNLAVFARIGGADSTHHAVVVGASAGAVYTGFLPSRAADQLGLAFATAWTGDAYRRAARAAGVPAPSAETAIELTYRVQLAGWLAVQPDLQIVIDPGTDRSLGDAVVLGLRAEITL